LPVEVVLNMFSIVGNALKFTSDGDPVRFSGSTVAGGREVSMADTGPVIPKENGTSIFEMLPQVPVRDSDRIKGSGLDLAMVNHIILIHGGQVWVESEPGKGSAFVFVLPA
jgi:signal transduction histidine kinase